MIEVVPLDTLKALAAVPPKDNAVFPRLVDPHRAGDFDIRRWAEEHGVTVVQWKPFGDGGTLGVLPVCFWNPAHTNHSAYIGQHASGAPFAGCHHNGCSGKGWNEFRDVAEPGWRSEEGPTEAVDDPDRLARLYLDSNCQHPDGPTLRSHLDVWQRWHGTGYTVVPAGELDAELLERVKSEFDRVSIETRRTAKKATPSLVSAVRLALRSKLIVPASRGVPCWVDGDGPWPASEVLAAVNGLFHLPSLAEGEWSQIPPTPRFFSPNVLDYPILKEPGRPSEFLGFVDQLWPDDPECIATLQEFMGLYLTHDTRFQKILMMIGPKRSGKGTLARTMTALIGPRNVAGPTLSSLKTNFGLQQFLGKTLAIFSDARLKSHDDAVVERLLTISGEDLITVDRKYADPISVRLPTRLVYISNELPRFKDASGALAHRMVILPLAVSFFGREDHALGERLLKERSGILLWAIEGWKRLMERRRFVQPESGNELLSTLETESNPVGPFVKACCKIGPFLTVPKHTLYEAYLGWCEREGVKHPYHSNTFGHYLRISEPTVSETHPTIDGKRVWCYTGIFLDV